MPSSGSQAPTLPPGPCAPHVSPSTSALSLVLTTETGRGKSAICWASYMSPHRWRGGAGEEPWDLGAPCTTKLKLLLESQLTGSAVAMLPLLCIVVLF